MDTLSAQTTLMPHIITSARIKGMMPIMIDRSDLDSGINRLFAAVCFRRRGLPLLSRVSCPEELNPSHNRLEEMFIRRPVTHLPTTVRPLTLADRGFGRASLLLFMQRLPTLIRCSVAVGFSVALPTSTRQISSPNSHQGACPQSWATET
ncbi:MAG: hypothetical protein F4Y44_02870, partial [Chloroflexi bacterium]|nr:hypothetical protein [Chloroflexota bacterium]